MATEERLEICAAGERGGDADEDFSWPGNRSLDFSIIDLSRFE
jgi:hypothetical protein